MEKQKIDKITVIGIFVPIILMSIEIIYKNNYMIIASLICFIQIVFIYIKTIKNKHKISIRAKKVVRYICIAMLFTYFLDLTGGYIQDTFITTTLIFGNIFIIFFLCYYTDNKKETFEYIIKIFIAFVCILCVYGLIIRFFGTKPRVYLENGIKVYRQELSIGNIKFTQRTMGDSQGNFAITSLTVNANIFSYLILYAFNLNYILLKEYKNKNKKYKYRYILFILLFITMFFAGSRMGILLIIFSYFMINFFTLNIKNKFYYLFVFCAIIVLMVLMYILVNNGNIYISIDLNGREGMWNLAPEIIEENTFIGKGLDAASNILQEKLHIKTSMFNSYLTMISNYGLVITIIFFSYILYVIYKNIIDYNKSNNYVILISVVFLITALIQGCVEDNILRYDMWSYLYYFVLSQRFLINEEIEKNYETKSKSKENKPK